MIATLCLVLFVVLAAVAATGPLPGDRWMLTELHSAFGTSVDDAMLVVSDTTDTLMVIAFALVILGVLVLRTPWRTWARFLLAFGVVIAVTPILKEVIGRARPDVRSPPEPVSALTFPSGHAAGTAALVGALLIVVPRNRLRTLVVVGGGVLLGIVAFSQLVLSVHYPSDILGGWLLAGASVAVVAAATGSRSERRRR